MRHDGRLWFEDRPGGGTRFLFTLDLLPATPVIAAGGAAQVLICEDDPDIAALLGEMVAAIGYESCQVGTAAAARAALADSPFSVLLLDLNLPDESGLSLAQSLGDDKDRSPLPIIMVSAQSRGGLCEPLSVDIVDWIEKPIDPARLGAALTIALANPDATRTPVPHLDADRSAPC
jgi:DNA-binding response OmpR family regulator